MIFLVFGDVMGRIGREAVKRILPEWREKYLPDFVIANVENLSHGSGVSPKTIGDLQEAGVVLFTSGNHVFDKEAGKELLAKPETASFLVRPENMDASLPGRGWTVVKKNGIRVLLFNLMGTVFFEDPYGDPFRTADRILAEHPADIRLLDFHAEATSEKVALAHHLDGRVTALWGTHTHVPTADERLLPKGTAFISDIGMVGGLHGSLGIKIEPVLDLFLNRPKRSSFEPIEEGPCEINAIIIETGADGKAVRIERIRSVVSLP
ncbi:MAG TPA: TIGR00282 family metallophosphoesterase [Patescibacteria group bacterium]|nr:TIGR00282 family metallophosphoesterase [Patescibacteria group bacterium]